MPEGVFGAKVRGNTGAQGIEEGYAAEMSEISDLLARFSPSADFTRLAYLPWDFHNLKAAVLRKLDGRGGEELFGPEGEVSVSRLSAMAESKEFGDLPPMLFDALQQAWIAYYDEEKDTQVFELSLDRQMDLSMEKTARSLSSAIGGHRETVSDLTAADVFFRAYFARFPWKSVSWSFAGHPDLARLKELYHLKVEDWGGRITSLSRGTLSRLFLAVRSLGDASAAVERGKRDRLRSMTDWRYKPPSVEYAYYFLARKLSDLYNLRLVLLCALNGVPQAEVKGRINDAFI